MIDKLMRKLDFKLLNCQFSKRDNLLFLDIEIDSPTLVEIEKKSKIISNILDEIDQTDKEYYLNIYSSGTEKNIDWENIHDYLEENIKIKLINPILDSHDFEGTLIEVNESSIKMKINMKGCIRKLEFQNSNIKQFKQSIKLNKKRTK